MKNTILNIIKENNNIYEEDIKRSNKINYNIFGYTLMKSCNYIDYIHDIGEKYGFLICEIGHQNKLNYGNFASLNQNCIVQLRTC